MKLKNLLCVFLVGMLLVSCANTNNEEQELKQMLDKNDQVVFADINQRLKALVIENAKQPERYYIALEEGRTIFEALEHFQSVMDKVNTIDAVLVEYKASIEEIRKLKRKLLITYTITPVEASSYAYIENVALLKRYLEQDIAKHVSEILELIRLSASK